ncbi:UNVERIFIED_CONTAM: hypothetical protein Slati_3079200 [Sesamum latifolium]|uniref:DUF4283 domain-containing protein n=1 Tax=Sesamum latifolium TaxID=2727402 RepID=A0AAW2UUG3_9LAMI
MDSHQTLSSLSHTTHTEDAHAHVRNPTSVESDADGDGGDASIQELITTTEDSIGAKVRHEFMFSDFHSLATRVLDGDEASLKSLNRLNSNGNAGFLILRRATCGLSVAFCCGSIKEPGVQNLTPQQPLETGLTPSPDFFIEAFAKANWKGLQHVSATANGFYFFTFKISAFMEEVMEEGPWLFQGQPMVLQAWEQGMSLRRYKHMQVPVWIRLRHLPMEYWTEDGLSVVASGVGVPLYTDKIMKSCSRLDYARSIIREGKEVPIKVDIEYEWLPMRCTSVVLLAIILTIRALDLSFLRPGLKHTLTLEEANALTSPVTPAFFDISEDSAPGPDGYSSAFFKTAWPVIGGDVCARDGIFSVGSPS